MSDETFMRKAAQAASPAGMTLEELRTEFKDLRTRPEVETQLRRSQKTLEEVRTNQPGNVSKAHVRVQKLERLLELLPADTKKAVSLAWKQTVGGWPAWPRRSGPRAGSRAPLSARSAQRSALSAHPAPRCAVCAQATENQQEAAAEAKAAAPAQRQFEREKPNQYDALGADPSNFCNNSASTVCLPWPPAPPARLALEVGALPQRCAEAEGRRCCAGRMGVRQDHRAWREPEQRRGHGQHSSGR